MIIIGVDYHPSDQYLAFLSIQKRGEPRRAENGATATEKPPRFIENSGCAESACAWECRPRDMERRSAAADRTGPELWIGVRIRSKPKESASRKPIATMRNFCCSCSWTITFPRSWVPSPEIVMDGNGSCHGIGWCRCSAFVVARHPTGIEPSSAKLLPNQTFFVPTGPSGPHRRGPSTPWQMLKGRWLKGKFCHKAPHSCTHHVTG